ncbi:MAG: ERF family protein [Gammaproteobacteria bacterium]|nr:ERF family protein [Gammaproteobacteria bacterium]
MNAIIERAPEAQSEARTIIQVIERAAMNPEVDIEKMERLLAMQERIHDRTAKAAYAAALAAMQPELPIIGERGGIRDRGGNIQSRYALWEDIVGIVTPILSRHGFALSFRTGNDANGVTVTGVLSHREGHSEQTSLTLPIDTSGNKNAVQSVGSSTSYGKRYTASALLNLRTGESDDDGQAGDGPVLVNEEQVANLEALISEVGANRAAFLKYIKVASLEQIPVASYESCVKLLQAKRARS